MLHNSIAGITVFCAGASNDRMPNPHDTSAALLKMFRFDANLSGLTQAITYTACREQYFI
jgi:hypothetical protein